jgi:hypothetical protein
MENAGVSTATTQLSTEGNTNAATTQLSTDGSTNTATTQLSTDGNTNPRLNVDTELLQKCFKNS